MRNKILFVVTSTDRMGSDGEPTGLWLSEFTVPYFLFVDAGYGVDVCSPKGGPVVFDPRSLEGAEADAEANRRFQTDAAAQGLLADSLSVSDVNFAGYAAIFLPGGHGTLWDLPHSEGLARGLEAAHGAGKPVAAVCHGPAGFLMAKMPDGRPLVAGRRVSAFTGDEERAVGLAETIPFMLDARLRDLGAIVEAVEPWGEYAVDDDGLITGQNPQSSWLVANLLLDRLEGRATGGTAPNDRTTDETTG